MSGVLERYEALVAGGELLPDPDQRIAAERLAKLQTELENVPKRGSARMATRSAMTNGC